MSNDELDCIKGLFNCLDEQVRDDITVCLAALEQNNPAMFERSQQRLRQIHGLLRQLKARIMPDYSNEMKGRVLH